MSWAEEPFQACGGGHRSAKRKQALIGGRGGLRTVRGGPGAHRPSPASGPGKSQPTQPLFPPWGPVVHGGPRAPRGCPGPSQGRRRAGGRVGEPQAVKGPRKHSFLQVVHLLFCVCCLLGSRSPNSLLLFCQETTAPCLRDVVRCLPKTLAAFLCPPGLHSRGLQAVSSGAQWCKNIPLFFRWIKSFFFWGGRTIPMPNKTSS